jgi:uncharacterized protein
MPTPITITPTTARRLAVAAQRLSGAHGEMYDTIRALGCLQLDPTNIVSRNHTLVLWSRLGAYDPAEFERLMWGERRLFEYWAHAASIVLTEDYPIHQAQMVVSYPENSAWGQRMRGWVLENAALRDHVLSELATRGPLQLREIQGNDLVKSQWISGGWSTERNIARMMDYLWVKGEVLIYGRSGQNRLWHLAERVLPEWTPRETLTPREVTRRALPISLRALGIGTAKHIRSHYVRNFYDDLNGVINDSLADGTIQTVDIVENGKAWAGTWYIHKDTLSLLAEIERGDWQPRTTLLSPFDNLICDRARTELMWDFYFRLEIYVPKHKRQYGYFVMPILHGDRLIGRIDPQMDRKHKRLIVNAIHWEADAPRNRETTAAVHAAIESLAGWQGATDVVMPEG